MKILALSSWFPYPPDNGSKIRTFNLIKELAKRHQIHLLSFIREENDKNHISSRKDYCETVGIASLDVYNPMSAKAIAGFLTPTPRSVVSTYNREMQQLVDAEISRQSFDVVISMHLDTANYVAEMNHVPKVLDQHNVESLFSKKQSALQASRFSRFRYWLSWVKAKRYESRICSQFDACAVVSEIDKKELLRICPNARLVEVIPNGVDFSFYHFQQARNRQQKTLVYNGALTYVANEVAVFNFYDNILPRVRKEIPEVKLIITGKYNEKRHSWLALDKNITLTNYVADIRPFVANSSVCIVPLTIGGGTRLKILEAMALGTPVVSTSAGAEGLDVTHDENILIADDPQIFARYVINLFQDTRLRERIAMKARACVEEKYSWTTIGEQLHHVLMRVVADNLHKRRI